MTPNSLDILQGTTNTNILPETPNPTPLEPISIPSFPTTFNEPTIHLSEEDRTKRVYDDLFREVAKQNKAYQRDPYQKIKDAAQPQQMSGEEAELASRYTDHGFDYLRGRNNEAVAAAKQGYWTQVWNDTKGTAANFGAGFFGTVLTIPQAIKALSELAYTQDIGKAWETMQGEEGSWLRGLNQLNDEYQKSLINYQSDWAAQNPGKNMIPFYGGEGGSDFGSLARSSGFILGGLATTAVEAIVADALAPVTGGLSLGLTAAAVANLNRGFRTLDALGDRLSFLQKVVKQSQVIDDGLRGAQVLSKAAKVWNGVQTPIGSVGIKSALHGLLINNAESSMEAYGVEKEFEKKLRDDYKSKYGEEAPIEKLAEFKQLAKQAGNATFTLNHTLLGINNHFQFGNIFKNFPAAKKIFGEVEELYTSKRVGKAFETVKNNEKFFDLNPDSKWYQKAFVGAGNLAVPLLKSVTVGNLSEGLEEGLQSAISAGTQQYYQLVHANTGKGDLENVLQAAGTGLGQAFGTKEGWMEVIGGALIGAIFEGSIQKAQELIYDKELKANADRTTELLNQQFVPMLSDKNLYGRTVQQKAESAAAGLTTGTILSNLAVAGDQYSYQRLKTTAQFAHLVPFVQTGATQVLKDQLSSVKDDIRNDFEEFKKTFGLDPELTKEDAEHSVSELENKLKSLDAIHKQYQIVYKNPYPVKDKSNHLQWESYYTELLHNRFQHVQGKKQLQQLISEIQVYGNVETLKDFVSKHGLENYLNKLEEQEKQMDALLLEEEKAFKDSSKPEKKKRKDGETTDETATEFNERVEQEFSSIRKELEKSQKTARKRIKEDRELLGRVEKGGYKYDDLVGAIRTIMRNPEGTVNITVDNNQELNNLLQKVYDVTRLQESLERIGELHDELTRTDGFNQFTLKKEAYQRAQKEQEQKRRDEHKKAYYDKVREFFESDTEVDNLVSDFGALADPYYAHYEQTGEIHPDLGTRIKQMQNERKSELQEREAIRSRIHDILVIDEEVTKRENQDPEFKELDKLINKEVKGIALKKDTTAPVLHAIDQIKQAHIKKFPIQSGGVQIATEEEAFEWGRYLASILKSKYSGTKLIKMILASPETYLTTDTTDFHTYHITNFSQPIIVKRNYISNLLSVISGIASVKGEEIYEKIERDTGLADSLFRWIDNIQAGRKWTDSLDMIYDVSTESWEQKSNQSIFDEEEPPVTEEEPYKPITQDEIDKALKGVILSSARSKINETALFMMNGVLIHASTNDLETNEELRKAHELAATRRVELMRNYVDKKLVLPLRWELVDGKDLGMQNSEPLPMEPGLYRTPAQYMIGYYKENGNTTSEDAFIALPVSHSLKLTQQAKDALTTDKNRLPQHLRELLDFDIFKKQPEPFLIDLLRAVGDEAELVYNQLKLSKLIPFRETYQEFIDFMNTQESFWKQITEHPDPEQFLNGYLSLTLATGTYYRNNTLGNTVPINDLVISSVDGYKGDKLGFVHIDNDGNVSSPIQKGSDKDLVETIQQGINDKSINVGFGGNYLVVRTDGQNTNYVLLRVVSPDVTGEFIDSLINLRTNNNGILQDESGNSFVVIIGGKQFEFSISLTDDHKKLSNIQLKYEDKQEKYYSENRLYFLGKNADKTIEELAKGGDLKNWIREKLTELAEGEFIHGANPTKIIIPLDFTDTDSQFKLISSTPRTEMHTRSVVSKSTVPFKRVTFQWGLKQERSTLGVDQIIVPNKEPELSDVEDVVEDDSITITNDMKEELLQLGINETVASELAALPYFVHWVDPFTEPIRYELSIQALKDNAEYIQALNDPDFNFNRDHADLTDYIYLPNTTPTTRLIPSRVTIEQEAEKLVKIC